MNCPKCGQYIESTASECPACGNNLTLTPRSYQSSFIRFARRHFKLSERVEIAIVGVAIGLFSLFLPRDDGFIWSVGTYLSVGTVLAQNEMNVFNLFAANNLAILLSASLFVAGMLLTILNRWFVIAEFIGLMGLTFTMSSYVISKLPVFLTPHLPHQTSFGIGYFLGWLSILISVTMLIDEKRGIGRGLPASEKVTIQQYTYPWRRK